MIEQIAMAVLGSALAYLIGEVNQIQKDVKGLLLKVAVLSDRVDRRRKTDNIDTVQ